MNVSNRPCYKDCGLRISVSSDSDRIIAVNSVALEATEKSLAAEHRRQMH
jgi:hypothetical protein